MHAITVKVLVGNRERKTDSLIVYPMCHLFLGYPIRRITLYV